MIVTFKLGTCLEKRKQEAPQQCDCRLKKAREKNQCKREEETPQQHDCRLEKAREKAQCKREEETPDQCDHC